jgi:cytochrome oxidase Cu insertion factor (SCO1/SenC/PrrC family)
LAEATPARISAIKPKNWHQKPAKEVSMAIQEGKAAPAFTLPDANGNKVSLKDFRGKNVIVYFYPKDNTSG